MNYIAQFSLLLTLVVCYKGQAEEATVLEVGPAISVVNLPDYIGSEEMQTLVLPFPYIKYIGKNWRVDRNFVNRALFANNQWSLDLSFSGSLPVDSENNHARRGMNDLKPTLEVGPWLQYRFLESSAAYWRADWAIRKATATDLQRYENAGWTMQAQLFYHRDFFQREVHWELDTSLSALWGDARQHDYFYGVDETEEMITRPAYSASAGFSGWRASLGLTRRQGAWWSGVFIRYINVTDATFATSPLVTADDNVISGLGFAYVF